MTSDFNSDKVKLWTRQHKNILNEIEKYGVYKVKKEYILEKMDTISDYYLSLYKWYGKNASKIVPKPEDVTYPIWLSTSHDMMLQPVDGTVVLEIEVNKRNVVYTDVNKWGYVVNYFYLPLNEEDEEKHNAELKRYGISDESSLIRTNKGNFYPLLKSKIIKSWDRLFEPFDINSTLSQATLWEIKKEWVVNIIHG